MALLARRHGRRQEAPAAQATDRWPRAGGFRARLAGAVGLGHVDSIRMLKPFVPAGSYGKWSWRPGDENRDRRAPRTSAAVRVHSISRPKPAVIPPLEWPAPPPISAAIARSQVGSTPPHAGFAREAPPEHVRPVARRVAGHPVNDCRPTAWRSQSQPGAGSEQSGTCARSHARHQRSGSCSPRVMPGGLFVGVLTGIVGLGGIPDKTRPGHGITMCSASNGIQRSVCTPLRRIPTSVSRWPTYGQAYDSFRAGRFNGRAVVIPGTRAA
jgi:hypothetical protein